jgi:hypothetical protein
MVPTYNGWEDIPEDEREALEQWEARERVARRSSQRLTLPDVTWILDGTGYAG